MDQARKQVFVNGVVEPKGKVFCLKNALIWLQAEQTGATHTNQRRRSRGEAHTRPAAGRFLSKKQQF